MTTTEEVIRLAREAGFQTGTLDAGKESYPFAQPCVGRNCIVELAKLIDLVRAEENDACAKACEDRAGTMSMFATTRDAKTHNAAVKGDASTIRARVK